MAESKKNNDKPKTGTEVEKPAEATAAAETAPVVEESGPPAGYLSTASDAVGFFDGDLRADGNDKGKGKGFGIHFIPMHCILSDSTIDTSKPSVLIFGRLVDPCKAVRDGATEGPMSERPLIPTKRGDVVGIWFSAGMRDLATLCDAKVYMCQEDEKNWKKIKGKPSKMKTYAIGVDPNRTGKGKLPVREDRRNESAGASAAPFAGKKVAGANGAVDTGDAADVSDDLPF